MSDPEVFAYFFIGIILSIAVPIAMRWIAQFRQDMGKGSGDIVRKVWRFARPYVIVAVASAIIGFLLLAVFRASGNVPSDWNPFTAILYGYAWDSTLQKLSDGLQGPKTT